MKKIMLVLIIISINSAYAQIKDRKSFSFSIDYGANYFLDVEGYPKNKNFTLNSMSINCSYLIGNNEIGLVVGKNDVAIKETRYLYFFDSAIYTSNYLGQKNISWYGIEYKYYFKELFNAGIKVCHVDGGGTYHELTVGKLFNISDDLFLKLSINYSIVTGGIFNFKSSSDYQLGSLAGFYVKL